MKSCRFNIVKHLDLESLLPDGVKFDIHMRELTIQRVDNKEFAKGEAHNIFHIIAQAIRAEYIKQQSGNALLFDEPKLVFGFDYKSVIEYFGGK